MKRSIRPKKLIISISLFLGIFCSISVSAEILLKPPTLETDKQEVRIGESIEIFGTSVPRSDIMLLIYGGEKTAFIRLEADKAGKYSYSFSTRGLNIGTHYIKAKAMIGNLIMSEYSISLEFKVSDKSVSSCTVQGDFNGDCQVDLKDFSLLAYWRGRELSSDFSRQEKDNFNGDGKIDLSDFIFFLKNIFLKA